MRFPFCLFVLAVFPWTIQAQGVSTDPLDNWHQWRGPLASGEAPRGNPPVKWDEKSNVKWKVAIKGKSSATPIVWGNRVFTVTAYDTGEVAPDKDIPKVESNYVTKTQRPKTYHEFVVLCFDRNTGKELWRKMATREVPHEGCQPTHSYAAGSPCTDGKFLYVSFGSRGVYCYDLDGNLQWKKRLGMMYTRFAWGEASTPALYKDTLIVPWDHEGQSYVFALNAKTGDIRWKKERDEPTCWATPLIVEHGGKVQVILNGTNKVRSYDLATGDVIWQCGGQSINAIPSPISANGIAWVMSGYQHSAAYAFSLDAKGDIANTNKVLWKLTQGTPYVPSPALVNNRLYFTHKNLTTLTCVDAQTGKQLFQERLPEVDSFYASPVAAARQIYLVDRDGTTLVIEQADKLKVLAVNKLNDGIDGSPAIVGNQIFLRGHGHLYCLEEKK